MIEIMHMNKSILMKDGFPFINGNEEARKHFARNLIDFETVAEIDTDDLEVAFELSNNIRESWVENKGVNLTDEGKALVKENGGIRSSSVGDVFLKNGNFFVVAGMGFEEITFGKK